MLVPVAGVDFDQAGNARAVELEFGLEDSAIAQVALQGEGRFDDIRYVIRFHHVSEACILGVLQ